MLAPGRQRRALTTRSAFAKEYGLDQEKVGFGDFTKSGYWDADDVLRPIFPEAREVLGREFEYPENK